MAHKKNPTIFQNHYCNAFAQPNPIPCMLDWLYTQLVNAEVNPQLGAEKIFYMLSEK